MSTDSTKPDVLVMLRSIANVLVNEEEEAVLAAIEEITTLRLGVKPAEPAAADPEFESRWRCAKCKSTNVEVSFPAWFREDKSMDLHFKAADCEADILSWYCPDCHESEHGEPEANEDIEEGEPE